jgi:hypothetical protein
MTELKIPVRVYGNGMSALAPQTFAGSSFNTRSEPVSWIITGPRGVTASVAGIFGRVKTRRVLDLLAR